MKSKLRFWLIVLALITGGPAALAQPALGLAPAGQQLILHWSTPPGNYMLQNTTNLGSPNWGAATGAVVVVAATVSNTVTPRFFRLAYPSPPAGLVYIPAGAFVMGDTLDGESDARPTNIYVSGFYMDTNLVTYSLWQTVYNYATKDVGGFGFVNAGAGKGTNYPVETVDWFDCVKWCNARSYFAGLTPVYYTDAALTHVYTIGEAAPYVNRAANGFRLPTEAEWERAARGGLSGLRFPWGDRIDENQANYLSATDYSYDLGPYGYNATGSAGGTSPATSPVASFDVNAYGLNDMAGNVLEWCGDWYGTPYGQPAPTNPTGPPSSPDNFRVLRGGYWDQSAGDLRCAQRTADVPNDAVYNEGFRCVKGL